jgi:hypothetical protein
MAPKQHKPESMPVQLLAFEVRSSPKGWASYCEFQMLFDGMFGAQVAP